MKLFMEKGFGQVEDCLQAAKIKVQSIRSTCGSAADEANLIDIIKAKEGGFARLDKVACCSLTILF